MRYAAMKESDERRHVATAVDARMPRRAAAGRTDYRRGAASARVSPRQVYDIAATRMGRMTLPISRAPPMRMPPRPSGTAPFSDCLKACEVARRCAAAAASLARAAYFRAHGAFVDVHHDVAFSPPISTQKTKDIFPAPPHFVSLPSSLSPADRSTIK